MLAIPFASLAVFCALWSIVYASSADSQIRALLDDESSTSWETFATDSPNNGTTGNQTYDSSLIDAFPQHSRTAFFISATTTLCVLLSCSFIIGLYEVHSRVKKRPTKTHT